MAEFEDNWVTRAVADDTLAAIVLLSFRRPYLNVHWSIRQRRFKLHTAAERKAEPNKDSPTTSTSEIATTPLVSEKTVLEDPPQLVEEHCDPSPQTVQDKVLDDESLVSQQEEINNEEPKFLLPDLNLPAEEEDVIFSFMVSTLS